MPAIVFGNATKSSRFPTFDKVQNPLWLPHKTPLQRPKVARAFGALYILTSIFFNISSSKSAPTLRSFEHFSFKMCFAPQRRALFRQCNFLKVLRSCRALYSLTWKCALRHNGVQFFISHLASWLRTRRFSEPTFRPSGATNHWKNTAFRDFPNFSRTWIFFLLTLSLL